MAEKSTIPILLTRKKKIVLGFTVGCEESVCICPPWELVLWEITVCQKSSVTQIFNYFALGGASTSSNSISSLSSVLHTTNSAAILWALEMVKCNFSGLSCNNRFQLKKKFPDSGIAKSSSIQRTHSAYNIHFGLAPLFFSELI